MTSATIDYSRNLKTNFVYPNNRPVQQTAQTPATTPKSNHKKEIGIGLGLACLAAGGIYIAKGKKPSSVQNIDKVFEQVQNSTSIMDTLKTTRLEAPKFKELMFRITGNEELSEKFINEVTADTRKSKEHAKLIKEKIGGSDEMLDWALQPKGYQEAYYRHAHKVYNSAKKPDDLIGVSPNWTVWSVKNKFGQDFSFGDLPQGIENMDKYREVFYAGLSHPEPGFEHSGVKFGSYIYGGLSGKSVRKMEINGKNYILKHQDKFDNVDLNDNITMKSDSAFLNAQLERYLQLHDYQQGPKLKLYDYKTNSALYEMTEGVSPSAESVTDIVDINKQLGDLNSLGVYYNDLNASNFLVSDNKLNFIDSGESSYIDFFRPGVTAMHFTLPNLNGRSYSDMAASVALAK